MIKTYTERNNIKCWNVKYAADFFFSLQYTYECCTVYFCWNDRFSAYHKNAYYQRVTFSKQIFIKFNCSILKNNSTEIPMPCWNDRLKVSTKYSMNYLTPMDFWSSYHIRTAQFESLKKMFQPVWLTQTSNVVV